MTPARLQTIKEIFHAALDCEPDQLNAFLDETCAGDEVLHANVEALLASHRQAGNFIETPVASLAASIVENGRADLLIGQMIGHYKISKRIGSGGMGEVYLASDISAGRKAALKLLPTQLYRRCGAYEAVSARSARCSWAQPSKYPDGLRDRRGSAQFITSPAN